MGGFTATLSAGAVGGSTLALVAMVVVATALSGWYDEHARRADGALRRGARLRPGRGTVRGVARPVDGRPGGLLVTTTRTQFRFGGGAWRDAGRTTAGSPFALVLDGGEEIELDPRDAFVEGGTVQIQGHAFSRDLVYRVSAGDTVWVTGIVSPRREHRAGAYRSGVARARITAPRRGHVTISRESPAPRWRKLAAAHKTGAYVSAGLGALVHAVVYRQIDLALLLRDSAGLAQRLDDPRGFGFAVFGGFMAVLIAAVVWRIRVMLARGVRL